MERPVDPENLDRFVRGIWLVLATAAGLGVVTMVIVQLLKDLLPLRSAWQRHWIWSVVRLQAAKVRADPALALDDLINVATAGNSRALYDLPIEQLGGQFNSASQLVLDFPASHSDLLRVLVAGADAADLQTLLSERPQARTMAAARTAGTPVDPQLEQAPVRFVDARNRVTHQVQRNLDALQIAMTFRWKLILQVMSLVVGSACAAATAWAIAGPPNGTEWVVKVAVIGILGGFLSTVARDLTAAIQNLRGRG
jgi:hypothetical protein